MTTTTEATMTTQHGPNSSDPTPEPLGPGWMTVTVVIGVMAALIALAGMTLSFHAVSVRMTPTFGPRWAWLVPLVVDLTVLVFSGVDLVLNRLDMSHPLARWTVYGATGGTVWLNYAAGGDLTGRIAHVLMPSVWVMFVELMRHVVRRTALREGASLRQPIPAARWLLSPWPTLKLWRRMILWRVHSYPAALAQERIRLARVAAMRDQHGRAWRWKVSAAERLSIDLGESGTPPVSLAATPADNDTPRATGTPADPDTTPGNGESVATPTPASASDTPKSGATSAPTRQRAARVVSALPVHDLDTDVAQLDAAISIASPAWKEISKADAIRNADRILPGRTASQVVNVLARFGVKVDDVLVRKTRSRDRQNSSTPASAPDDQAEFDETSRSA